VKALAATFNQFWALRRVPPAMIGRGLGFAFILIFVLVWALLTLGDIPEERLITPAILPSPWEVFGSLPVLFLERGLMPSIAASLLRVLQGFGLAVLVGVPLGFVAGSWRPIERFLAPIVLFGRNVPIAALVGLTMMWFGLGETQKVMFIFIAAVPFIFSISAAALISINQRYVETGQTLGANPRQIVIKILVPLALPDVYTSLRSLFGLAFGYIMLAEVIDAKHGLGHLINMSRRRGALEDMYLILLVIALLAYGIDRVLVVLQRGLFPYRKDLA